jgi:hypothetical protein
MRIRDPVPGWMSWNLEFGGSIVRMTEARFCPERLTLVAAETAPSKLVPPDRSATFR